MFGKLSLDAVPFHEPIVMVTIAGIILGGLALVGLITYFGKWTYLWKEWLTSVDHKRLGIMYIIVAIVMLLRGFADAIMMRSQQALASAGEAGFLPPHHYDQIFTAHGVIMIFFVAMPFVIGLMNLVVPLQIGARDVAFPFLNNLSFWFTVVGVILVNVSLGVGEFAQTGWLAYPPLSGIEYSPGVGVDYWIWSLQLSGIGTTLTGINYPKHGRPLLTDAKGFRIYFFAKVSPPILSTSLAGEMPDGVRKLSHWNRYSMKKNGSTVSVWESILIISRVYSSVATGKP